MGELFIYIKSPIISNVPIFSFQLDGALNAIIYEQTEYPHILWSLSIFTYQEEEKGQYKSNKPRLISGGHVTFPSNQTVDKINDQMSERELNP